MQSTIDFVGLNKLNDSERKEFEKASAEFNKKIITPADITVHIKMQQSNKIILNARVITGSSVFNIQENSYDLLIALNKLLNNIDNELKEKSSII